MQFTLNLHLIGDLFIFVAYCGLAAWCLTATSRRLLSILFGSFIFLCGLTHLDAFWAEIRGYCEVSNLLFGYVKIATAIISIATMVYAWQIWLRMNYLLRKPRWSIGEIQWMSDRITQLAMATVRFKAIAEALREQIRLQEKPAD